MSCMNSSCSSFLFYLAKVIFLLLISKHKPSLLFFFIRQVGYHVVAQGITRRGADMSTANCLSCLRVRRSGNPCVAGPL